MATEVYEGAQAAVVAVVHPYTTVTLQLPQDRNLHTSTRADIPITIFGACSLKGKGAGKTQKPPPPRAGLGPSTAQGPNLRSAQAVHRAMPMSSPLSTVGWPSATRPTDNLPTVLPVVLSQINPRLIHQGLSRLPATRVDDHLHLRSEPNVRVIQVLPMEKHDGCTQKGMPTIALHVEDVLVLQFAPYGVMQSSSASSNETSIWGGIEYFVDRVLGTGARLGVGAESVDGREGLLVGSLSALSVTGSDRIPWWTGLNRLMSLGQQKER